MPLFALNRRLKMPAYVQLQEQIKHLILSGELAPGAQLPPANRLADNLQINRLTVLRAYKDLEQQGFVEFRSGVGTFVSAVAPRGDDDTTAPEVLRQLDHAIDAALALGLTPERITAHVLARANARAGDGGPVPGPPVRAALFECNEERLDYYARSMAKELDLQLTPLLISTLDRAGAIPELDGVDFAVTTFFHMVEVRRKLRAHAHLGSLELFAVSVRPHLDVLRNLAKLPDGTNLAILYFESRHYTVERLQAMVEHIQNAHLPNIRRIEPVYVRGDFDPAAVAGFDAVLIRPENLEATKATVALDVPVVEYHNVLDQASIAVLRDVVREVREARRAGDPRSKVAARSGDA